MTDEQPDNKRPKTIAEQSEEFNEHLREIFEIIFAEPVRQFGIGRMMIVLLGLGIVAFGGMGYEISGVWGAVILASVFIVTMWASGLSKTQDWI